MTRTPAPDLPVVLDQVSLVIRGAKVIDRVSLTLDEGAPTVVLGPNGAGKTTLLRLAMGLVQPTSGRVTWGGRANSAPKRRAIVFQRPVMLRRSAAANLHYALAQADFERSKRSERAEELLVSVGLNGLGNRAARRLSSGEQQRLALARALAKDPDVLLLDEPTASLDPAATKAVEDIVRDVATHGIKVIMATHDLGEARRLAGEIVLMHQGRVIEVADAATFFTRPSTAEAELFVAGELLL